MIAPADGMVISSNTVLAPGVYHLPGGLVIDGDGVTLDGSGALLVGAGVGRGVTIRGHGASPNIAFEATFSHGNIYRGNKANGCNYGFWLRFSREHVVERNEVTGSRRAGLDIELIDAADPALEDNSFEEG